MYVIVRHVYANLYVCTCVWICTCVRVCGLRVCILVYYHKHVHVCVFTLYKCLRGGFGVEIEGCLGNSSSSIMARVHNRHLCSIEVSVHDIELFGFHHGQLAMKQLL